MVLPSTTELELQLLNLLNDQDVHKLPEVKDAILKRFDITGEDRKKLYKSKRSVLDKRIIHSLFQLRKKGLIINQKRANFKITKSGINKLKNV
jgi:restriction endonuclease Mrr